MSFEHCCLHSLSLIGRTAEAAENTVQQKIVAQSPGYTFQWGLLQHQTAYHELSALQCFDSLLEFDPYSSSEGQSLHVRLSQ